MYSCIKNNEDPVFYLVVFVKNSNATFISLNATWWSRKNHWVPNTEILGQELENQSIAFFTCRYFLISLHPCFPISKTSSRADEGKSEWVVGHSGLNLVKKKEIWRLSLCMWFRICIQVQISITWNDTKMPLMSVLIADLLSSSKRE